jgi:hypothetical protein
MHPPPVASEKTLTIGQISSPLKTSFLFSPNIFTHAPRPLLRKADKARWSLRAKELDLLPRDYVNCKDIDAEVNRLVRLIEEAVAQHIPLSKSPRFLFLGGLMSSPSL